MALPNGITTATVTAGVPLSFGGAQLKQYVTITPSVYLVHTATGTPLVNFLEEISSEAGVAAQFTLPHTDQDGFQDEAGNAYKNWYYTANFRYTDGVSKTYTIQPKTFQIASGQTLVDIDLLPSGVPAIPYAAPVASVTSVGGLTGAITGQDIAGLQELSATYATPAAVTSTARTIRTKGNRVVAIGDSHTFNNDGLWLRTLCTLTGQRAIYGGHYATGGYTLEQIRDVHLPSVLALTGRLKPAACVVYGGTNNAIGGTGTTDGSTFNFANSRTAHRDITTALEAAGIMPILATIPPRGVYPVANNNVKLWNAYIQTLGADKGWPVLNFHDALANADGGFWITGLSSDEIHTNGKGTGVMVRAVAAQFESLFPYSKPFISTSRTDPTNLLPAGYQAFYADGNSDGISDNWVQALIGSGGQVFTRETGDATIGGAWQTLSGPAGSGGQACLKSVFSTGYAVGDRLAFSARVKALNFEANPTQSYYVRLDFNGSGGLISTLPIAATVTGGTLDIADGLAYAEALVPAGTTSINCTLMVQGLPSSGAGATLKVAMPTIINLTALGLT